MKIGIVAKTLGVLSGLIGATMALLMVYAWIEWKLGEQTTAELQAIQALGYSAAISIGVGALQVLSGARSHNEIMRREGIVIVGLSWIQVGLLGGLPYIFSDPGLEPVAAFFESVSGFTTTGSSVMTDIEAYPRAILMWRSVTQWLGGIGILVVFVAVLSFLGAGTKSLVSQESSLNLSDSGTSRIKDLTWALLKVYILLTSICVLGLWCLGMSPFDAVCHSMTPWRLADSAPRMPASLFIRAFGLRFGWPSSCFWLPWDSPFIFSWRAVAGNAFARRRRPNIMDCSWLPHVS